MLSLCHMQTNKKTKLVVKICSILFLGTFLFCACSSRERTETSFLQAESLLEEHPDSALQLLQTLLHYKSFLTKNPPAMPYF